jgi:class 3 adenylate cyclase
MSEQHPQIELAEAVESVRREVAEAAERAAGERFRFEIDTVELEFSVELRREARADGRVRAWVLEAGAEARTENRSTHRVTVTLTPVDGATGGNVLVGNDDLGSRAGFESPDGDPAGDPGSGEGVH